MTTTSATPVCEATALRVALPDRSRAPLFRKLPNVEILRGVGISVAAGEAVGLVGESGSGKTTLGRALLRLYRPSSGRIVFEGRDITDLDESDLRPLRARMQIIFQDPQSALNPRHRVADIISRPLLSYARARDRSEARDFALALLERVGMSADHLDRYPHQLSGGQRQRVGIARAIALEPALVVADEIVSGLDVSVQAQILALLHELQRTMGLALVFISHDLSVIRAVCDRVVVMHSGVIVEEGPCERIFEQPEHPYTLSLMKAIPLPEVDNAWLAEGDGEEPAKVFWRGK